MKTLLKLSAAALILVAGSASAVISGSAHDFSGSSWNPDGEICEVCHAPHNNQNAQDQLLWNHVSTTATFTPYDSPTMDNTMGQPAASSKVCLSCHDGTVALDNFGGTTTGTNFISGSTLVGIDLSNDHPISISYATAVTGGGFNADTTPSGIVGGGTIAEDMLEGGDMQCSSCHDVHNEYGLTFLLKKTNAASALCLTCHAK